MITMQPLPVSFETSGNSASKRNVNFSSTRVTMQPHRHEIEGYTWPDGENKHKAWDVEEPRTYQQRGRVE